MCQALGMRPVDKYNVGRPSQKMARLLRRFADHPNEQRALFWQLAFGLERLASGVPLGEPAALAAQRRRRRVAGSTMSAVRGASR
jgi:hypothetical protein